MTKTLNVTRVVLADECQLFQDGLQLLIDKEKKQSIKLIAKATNGTQLLDYVKMHKPHVVILSNRLKEIQTSAICKTLKSKYPTIYILILTQEHEEELLYELILSGVEGFIAKSLCKQYITNAINTLASGKPYYCNSISDKLFNIISKRNLKAQSNNFKSFSIQEIKVINLLCKQLTSKEIADQLQICPRTVEEYRCRIQEKIGAKNVVGVVLYALQNQLVQLNSL